MLYDKDIREPLFDFLEQNLGKVRILEEKQMGKTRADVVMVMEDALVGIEIKSDADSYTRLARQVKDYNQYYDYNYVVIGSSHAAHIKEHVPQWWGIITVDEIENEGIAEKNQSKSQADFYVLREPEQNPKRKMEKKIRILWRPELAHIQELNGMPKYKEKSKDFVREKILLKVPESVLQKQISEELFQRDYNTIQEQIQQFKVDNNRKIKKRRKIKYRRK